MTMCTYMLRRYSTHIHVNTYIHTYMIIPTIGTYIHTCTHAILSINSRFGHQDFAPQVCVEVMSGARKSDALHRTRRNAAPKQAAASSQRPSVAHGTRRKLKPRGTDETVGRIIYDNFSD